MKTKEKITEILYKNSIDNGEGLVIDFKNIEKVIDSLSMLCDYSILKQSKEGIEKISEEEALKGYQDHLTVGKLKEHIYKYNYDNSAPVFIQRVEDWYFKKGGWKTYDLENSYDGLQSYFQPWCAFKDKDKEILFIDMHY